jgi:hypothetical protein
MPRHSDLFVEKTLNDLRRYFDEMLPGERISLDRLRREFHIANVQTIRDWLVQRLGIEVKEVCSNFYLEKPMVYLSGGVMKNGEVISGLVGIVQFPFPVSSIIGYGTQLGTIVGTLAGTVLATLIAGPNTAAFSLQGGTTPAPISARNVGALLSQS